MNQISYIENNQINRSKWDGCINQAIGGVVYGYSWYLDIVCPNWNALVLGDYEAVMPLTGKNKLGFNYLFQPYFTQQLGVFSKEKPNSSLINSFITSIPKKYKYIEINFNYLNSFSESDSFLKQVTCHLDLISPYEKLRKGYNQNTLRNIKKAQESGIVISKGLQINTFIEFKKMTVQVPFPEAEYLKLRKIVSQALMKNMGEIWCAYNTVNELVAVAFFLFSHHFTYMLVSASNTEGKNSSAMFLLFDKFINEKSTHPITLDFEGSNIPNIARFFLGFGSVPVNYYRLKMNKLPWFLKWLK